MNDMGRALWKFARSFLTQTPRVYISVAPVAYQVILEPGIIGQYRLFDLQDSLDKRIHFHSQLSDVVPLRNGFYSFRAQTD